MSNNLNWFEEQLRTRRLLDEQDLEEAYARLAASVMNRSSAPRFTINDAAMADSAIAAVLAYYGAKPAPVPDEISDPYERIDYAVRPTGIMRRPVRLEGAWWKDASGAFLTELKEGGTVAVIPFGMRGYAFVDPVARKKIRVNQRTAQLLGSNALCFYRPFPQRELSLRDVWVFMMRSLRWTDWAMVLAATAVSTLIGLLPAILNNLLFSRIIPSNIPLLILPIAALMLGMTFSRALVQMTSSIIMSRIGIKLQVQVEAATYARTLLLPPSFFKEYAAGNIVSRVGNMGAVVSLYTQTFLSTVLNTTFSLVYVLQILAYTPSLVVPALAVTLTQLVAMTSITRRNVEYDREQMREQTLLSGLTPSLLRGIAKIKLAGAERRAFSHWAKSYAKVADKTYNRPALLLAGPGLIPLLGAVGTIAIYYLAATTKVSLASYMAFSSAFGSVSASMGALAMVLTTIASIQPMIEMVEPILRTVPEAVGGQTQVTSVSGSIEVKNVSFSYASDGPQVLEDVSLHIRSGEYVAVVGRTGCGKSTLMRLLLGFERPNKGAVYYDGQDISTVDIRSLRKHIGVVMQGGSLFQGDLYTNITVAYPKATMDDAWEAARMAGVDDVIRDLPMGMQTLLSEGGGGISGGQRQRILIARAVCGKPKILMFDEATSALDNLTQRHVSEALDGLRCTRLVIAHRLSTIRNADRIILLDDGRIAEEGTYDELIAKGGQFAALVERQRLGDD